MLNSNKRSLLPEKSPVSSVAYAPLFKEKRKENDSSLPLLIAQHWFFSPLIAHHCIYTQHGFILSTDTFRCFVITMDLSSAIITEHARSQMERRRISERDLRRLLYDQEEILPVRKGRVVVQGMSGEYLLRVFVDIDRHPPEVVTSYRTSNVSKYRRRR